MGIAKGSKMSDMGRRNLIKGWDDPERRAKMRILLLARLKRRGRLKTRSYKGSMSNIDPDFDELGQ